MSSTPYVADNLSNQPVRLKVDGDGNLKTVASGSASLPTGASTEAKQDTGNTSLSSIDTKLTRQGTLTDRSGATSASSNTSTELIPANASRKYLIIQNVGIFDVWINFGGSASKEVQSLLLEPKQGIVFEDSFVPTEAVHVYSFDGTSVPIMAKEG